MFFLVQWGRWQSCTQLSHPGPLRELHGPPPSIAPQNNKICTVQNSWNAQLSLAVFDVERRRLRDSLCSNLVQFFLGVLARSLPRNDLADLALLISPWCPLCLEPWPRKFMTEFCPRSVVSQQSHPRSVLRSLVSCAYFVTKLVQSKKHYRWSSLTNWTFVTSWTAAGLQFGQQWASRRMKASLEKTKVL